MKKLLRQFEGLRLTERGDTVLFLVCVLLVSGFVVGVDRLGALA